MFIALESGPYPALDGWQGIHLLSQFSSFIRKRSLDILKMLNWLIMTF